MAALRTSAPGPRLIALLLALGAVATGCGAEETAATEPPLEPLFTLAVLADPHVTGPGANADRLAAAVDWINAHAAERRIELVAVLGDIGWGDGVALSKQLLDALDLPYLPLIGDNEIHAGDDQAFAQAFAAEYQRLGAELDGFRQQPSPVHDPEYDLDAYLESFTFTHRGVRLFALDWCIRGQGGVMGEFGDTNDYPGGTLPWLTAELDRLEPGLPDSMVLLSHIPMVAGAFDNPEMAALGAVLGPRAGELWADLAGHVHGNLVMEEDGNQVIMFDATWDDELTVGLVEVQGNGQRFSWSHQLVVLP